MKKLLNKLGLYTEKDLTDFGNKMAEKNGNKKRVCHSDVQNFKFKILCLK